MYTHKPKKHSKRGLLKKPIHGKHVIPSFLRIKQFTDCQYIEGHTLRRYMRIEDDEVTGCPQFLVREPSELDVEEFCDGCIAYHEKKNIYCNKTLGSGYTFAQKMGVLYDFKTKTPTKIRLIETDDIRAPHSKIHLMVCKMTHL